MKAQMVKNAVIVPVGAKGGFVVKRRQPVATRRSSAHEVAALLPRRSSPGCSTSPTTSCDGDVVGPPARCATTATTPTSWWPPTRARPRSPTWPTRSPPSYGFWLGDAFASGGSVGYDHKHDGHHRPGRVGERAPPLPHPRRRRRPRRAHRRRHRRHVGRRVRQRHAAQSATCGWSPPSTTVTCSSTRTPTRRARSDERKRLFELPRSSWDDYDRALISAGGGVWPRSAKSIDAVRRGAAGARHPAHGRHPERAAQRHPEGARRPAVERRRSAPT